MRVFRSACLSLSMVLALSTLATPSFAQTFSLETQKNMTKAMEYMDKKKYSKAEKKLKDVLRIKGLSAYETSTIHSMIARATYLQKDNDDAIEHYQKALRAGGLQPAEALKTEALIGQLLITEGRNKEGATGLENWLRKTGNRDPKYARLIMQARLADDDYAKALPWAEKWFNGSATKERKHYDVLNFLYNEAGNSARQTQIVGEMLTRWPQDRSLWNQQLGLLSGAGKDTEAYQLYAAMYDRGLLQTETEIMKMVQYHEYYNNYVKAAQILGTEMGTGRIKSTDKLKDRLALLQRQTGK